MQESKIIKVFSGVFAFALICCVTLGLMSTQAFAEATNQSSGDDVLDQPLDPETVLEIQSEESTYAAVEEYAGNTLFETAARQALTAYSTCEKAILVGQKGWSDALSAVGLAGALDCPILFTESTKLNESTAAALSSLGVEEIIVIGGSAVVSDDVLAELEQAGMACERVSGSTMYDTQMEVYAWGAARSLWQDDAIVVATGTGFADALSFAPVAYAQSLPIFLIDSGKDLSAKQKETLVQLMGKGNPLRFIALGGTGVVSEKAQGFLEAVANYSGGSFLRLFGETLFDTSATIAEWSVSTGVLSWDKVAFATSASPYDALAGSVLQGKTGAALLLVNSSASKTIDAVATNKESIHTVRFFGGVGAISESIRQSILARLELVGNDGVLYEPFALSLADMTALEVREGQSEEGSTSQDISEYLNPASIAYGQSEFYQFAVLDEGYSGVLSSEQLDSFINQSAKRYEEQSGVTSSLRGAGAYIIDAAQKYDVNEAYLLAHIALESSWGTSNLSQGTVEGYEGYVSFLAMDVFGPDPEQTQAALAKSYEWTSVDIAIEGAAQWLSEGIDGAGGYFTNQWNQNTLYKMRWNAAQGASVLAASSTELLDQSSLSNSWAFETSSIMNSLFQSIGIDMSKSGLRFEVPSYVG